MLTVFIDGENFRQNLSKLLAEAGVISDKDDIFRYNIAGLLNDVLSDAKLDIRYYASEIKTPRGYTPTRNIQKQLSKIKEKMRRWVADIKTQGIVYIKAGNLKVKEGKDCYKCGAKTEILQEKGVDVRLALDIFESSLDKNNHEIAIFSSDTDLCPALHKAKSHGIKIKYICFASRVNRAVSAVCDETITITNQKLTKNLTTKEMYASIPETQVIVEFFKKGLEINNDRLAVSAMEELILRGDTDYIAYALNEAFEKGWVREGSTMISMIGRSLKDSCREVDGVLCRYGDGLTKGDFCGPFDWIVQHATDWGEDPRAGLLRKAKKWVREIIFPSSKSPFGEGRCYAH